MSRIHCNYGQESQATITQKSLLLGICCFLLGSNWCNILGGTLAHAVAVPRTSLVFSHSFANLSVLRGGGSVRNETKGIDENSSDGQNKTQSEKPLDGTTKQNATKSRSRLGAAFQMRATIEEEASAMTQGANGSQNPPRLQVEMAATAGNSSNSSMAHPGLVGGAAALAGPKSPPDKRMSPFLQTSRVAPLSSRLIQDSEDDTADLGNFSLATTNTSEVARFWWVNVWTQQLSAVEEEADASGDSEPTGPESDGSPNESSSGVISEAANTTKSLLNLSNLPNYESSKQTDTKNRMGQAKKSPPRLVTEKESMSTNVSTAVEPILANTSLVSRRKSFGYSDDSARSYVSTGMWVSIDNILSLGFARKYHSLRASTKLRASRKIAARMTGLHGVLSGKPKPTRVAETGDNPVSEASGIEKRNEKVNVEAVKAPEVESRRWRSNFGLLTRKKPEQKESSADESRIAKPLESVATEKYLREQKLEEIRRAERVKQIDQLIAEGQGRLQQLICEKDVLQRRPNPLFNYTTEAVSDDRGPALSNSTDGVHASRGFKFPPDDLVEEYLDMIFSSRRITRMNHTDLWKDTETDDEDEETIGDDLLTPSADAHILYRGADPRKSSSQKVKSRNGGGGSWLLRQSIGKGPSLGEKIGEAAETAAYKAVCAAVMSFLARTLSSLHGINVMKHSDIRLVLEQAPDLPRVGEGVIPGSSPNYAQETIKTVIRRKAKKNRKRAKFRVSEDSFVQRDAVTEMLLSHVQISAPLLKLFPLAWQRALLGNILTLSTSIISDFFDGLQFQILGHQLSFAFKPITQEDMMNHFGLPGGGFNQRRAKAEEFEAAVKATAEDVGNELKFLDRWHERALGSGVLRTQIANLIARVVLTLTDEVLSGSRMDLWSAHAGGPRLLAGLEYRNS